MQAALRGAINELAKGLATGLVVKAAVNCPDCSPSLTCPLCPDCVCSGGARVVEAPAAGNTLAWLILVLGAFLVGAGLGRHVARASRQEGESDGALNDVVVKRVGRGRGVLRGDL